MPLIARVPDVRSSDIRAIQRLAGQLTAADGLESLGREFIDGAGKILPADFMLWNLWTPAMDGLLSFEANHPHLRDALAGHDDALIATIHHHPVIAAGHLESAWIRPQRISDYQSDAAFRSNPLFQEVYRHLDSHHQIAYNAAKLEGANIVLSWNLRNRDFTDREVNVLHLLGRMVEVLSRAIEERRHLRAAWEAMAGCLGKVTEVADLRHSLKASDGRILSGLIAGEARVDIAGSLHWRRDTLDRHLNSLRERLGYENTPQLMQALACLRPHAGNSGMAEPRADGGNDV